MRSRAERPSSSRMAANEARRAHPPVRGLGDEQRDAVAAALRVGVLVVGRRSHPAGVRFVALEPEGAVVAVAAFGDSEHLDDDEL